MRSTTRQRVVASAIALLLSASSAPHGATAAESGAAARRVNVAAAADLKFAFDEIAAAFHAANPSIEVLPTYGSSGNFFAQLSNKAPFDLYLSADIAYPKKLIEQGQGVADTAFNYAFGEIVVWVPKASALDVEQRGIEALLDPSAKKIAIANPQHAPYGRAAEAALKTLGVYDTVKDRLVLGENIAQTAQFVSSGAADVGIIALSLAVAPPMRDAGRFWRVPTDAYPPIEQGGVILQWAADRAAADALRAFMLGSEGRKILERYGFRLP
ncbi:MAG: molybdate ABC transporter substrate-binding protein [Deltaproteobacteria bacterium]|nr:molybdate ABC transporter substrate-binding protein [Deltaproteobacteria bacterium]